MLRSWESYRGKGFLILLSAFTSPHLLAPPRTLRYLMQGSRRCCCSSCWGSCRGDYAGFGGYLAWKVWPVHISWRSWCDGWWHKCAPSARGVNLCPVWVHKCVCSHVSQAWRATVDDITPTHRFEASAEELRRFPTVSGVNRLVRLFCLRAGVLWLRGPGRAPGPGSLGLCGGWEGKSPAMTDLIAPLTQAAFAKRFRWSCSQLCFGSDR